MTGFNGAYEPAPLDGPNDREHRRRIAQVVDPINQGMLNCVYGTITLNANATSTTITDQQGISDHPPDRQSLRR